MTTTTTTTKPGGAGKQITLERVYKASLEDVWDLWTTKDGIESWWGPEGFAVTVDALELRAGAELRYTMTAVAPEQVAFMKKAGMPLATSARITYREVVPRTKLAYVTVADFVPGVAAYDVNTLVELSASAEGVRMKLTFDPMHDETWTSRAVMGHEGQLRKLARVLDARRGA